MKAVVQEQSSESEDSEDDKMLGDMILKAATPQLAKKFKVYIDKKMAVWQ